MNEKHETTTVVERPLSARELAFILGLHPVTLLKWARQGKLPCHRLGARKVVFLPREINQWLATGYAGGAGRAA